MKVIFLDIDGVLCTLRSHLAYHGVGGCWWDWDPVGCEVIKRCCKAGVKLVISSTWRLNCPSPMDDSSDLGLLLGKHGLREFIYMPGWRTPTDWKAKRGGEIQQWLDAHPDVTDYRILDDDSDMLDSQMLNFIKTDGLDGIPSLKMIDLMYWSGCGVDSLKD